MLIRAAAPPDISAIVTLIDACRHYLMDQGIDQWHPRINYPNQSNVEADIESKTLYLLEDDTACAGIITLSDEPAMEYAQVDWELPEGKFLYIKRLAVDPARQGQGLAHKLMDYAEEYARTHGYDAIRLDAYTKNPRARRIYERRGYSQRGEVFFPQREAAFFCFELILANK